MVLLSALAIKMIGIFAAFYFLRRGWREFQDTHHHHVSTSHVASPLVLLVWRLSMFAFTTGVLYVQVSERGTGAFRFFTVWNWTAIIVYFFLASIASSISVFGGEGRDRTKKDSSKRPTRPKRSEPSTQTNSTALSKTIATMFHVLTPMTLYIDIITWTVLVPALMKTPDLERRRHWENVMFSFISYAQHGLNAVIMGLEMYMNNIPNSDQWAHGVVCMWNVLFALWALFFFFMTGKALYPFLDYSKHPAELWMAFMALLASSMGSSYVVQKVLKFKWSLLGGIRGGDRFE